MASTFRIAKVTASMRARLLMSCIHERKHENWVRTAIQVASMASWLVGAKVSATPNEDSVAAKGKPRHAGSVDGGVRVRATPLASDGGRAPSKFSGLDGGAHD